MLSNEGVFECAIYRAGKLHETLRCCNANTVVGVQRLLDIVAAIQPTISTWYLGFISASGFTSATKADTWASKGWSEFTDYTVDGGTTNRIPTNPTTNVAPGDATIRKATSSIVLTTRPGRNIKGFFVIDSAAKGSSGLLVAAGATTNPLELWRGDELWPQYNFLSTLGPQET